MDVAARFSERPFISANYNVIMLKGQAEHLARMSQNCQDENEKLSQTREAEEC